MRRSADVPLESFSRAGVARPENEPSSAATEARRPSRLVGQRGERELPEKVVERASRSFMNQSKFGKSVAASFLGARAARPCPSSCTGKLPVLPITPA